MSAHASHTPVHTHPLMPNASQRLTSIAGSGFLGVGVPSHLGGHGGSLDELFRDPTALRWLQGLQHPEQLIFRSQRLVVEALVKTENIGLRELRLPDLLRGDVAGASALESPQLEAQTQGTGWQFHGRLDGVPNLQWDGFFLLLPVQAAGLVEGVLLVSSEENGMTVRPCETTALGEFAAYGQVHFNRSFLRADEWLGGMPLWESLVHANELLRQGLLHTHQR